MRKLALALTVVVLSVGPTLSQAPAGAWADKLFDYKTTHDFGTVARGAKLTYSFPMKNIYAVPLKINKPEPLCGCVTATASKEILQPREEGSIDIVMDPRNFQGKKTVNIKVTVGPEYISTAVLRVDAFIRTDVVFNGDLNFGPVTQGQQLEKAVDIEYAGKLDWRLELTRPDNVPFNVTLAEKFRKPGHVGYQLKAKLAPDAPAGILKYDLFLKTNDPTSEVLIVPVDATVRAPLQVTPSKVNLKSIKLGEFSTYKVQLLGTRPFRITKITADGPEVSAEVPQQALPVHNLTVRCQPLALGDLKRTLTIATDLDGSASVTVTIQAVGVER